MVLNEDLTNVSYWIYCNNILPNEKIQQNEGDVSLKFLVIRRLVYKFVVQSFIVLTVQLLTTITVINQLFGDYKSTVEKVEQFGEQSSLEMHKNVTGDSNSKHKSMGFGDFDEVVSIRN